MLNKVFAVILAVLIVNPICCCQDLSSLWSSETEMSCGCQQSSEDKAPADEPCSTCPSKMHKVSAEASSGLPSIQIGDIEDQPIEVVAYQVIPRSSGRTVLAEGPLATFRQTPLHVTYCVWLL